MQWRQYELLLFWTRPPVQDGMLQDLEHLFLVSRWHCNVACVYICLHVYILQNQSNEARIRELEDLLRKEKEARSIERDTLTTEVDRLRKAVDDQLMEYRDLMDMKIQLDAEISAYRKLLESEETR